MNYYTTKVQQLFQSTKSKVIFFCNRAIAAPRHCPDCSTARVLPQQRWGQQHRVGARVRSCSRGHRCRATYGRMPCDTWQDAVREVHPCRTAGAQMPYRTSATHQQHCQPVRRQSAHKPYGKTAPAVGHRCQHTPNYYEGNEVEEGGRSRSPKSLPQSPIKVQRYNFFPTRRTTLLPFCHRSCSTVAASHHYLWATCMPPAFARTAGFE